MSRATRAGAAVAAAVMPGIAAASAVPGSGLADVAAFVAATGLTAIGTTWPAVVSEVSGHPAPAVDTVQVRTAAVGASVAVTAAWSFMALPDAVAGAAVTVQLMAAAYAAYRGTDRQVRLDADRAAFTAEAASTKHSLTVREGQLKRRAAGVDEQAADVARRARAADQRDAELDAKAYQVELAPVAAELDAERDQATKVPVRDRMADRHRVALRLLAAERGMGKNEFVRRLAAVGHTTSKGPALRLYDTAQIELATMDAEAVAVLVAEAQAERA
ncbi:hypothetical protein [Streptomyces europaeiscabiei]|uniref:hypothetical protein n=1 Tax=Streptomyces europaeiscabiei TaxID=146819 RepID=UPI0029A5E11A|nr:hypothetical protein [Streptomyces europaeiscabiei]MDX3860055.1 hypothetical protein [Streptomyces europaeiscabiei]